MKIYNSSKESLIMVLVICLIPMSSLKIFFTPRTYKKSYFPDKKLRNILDLASLIWKTGMLSDFVL